MIKQSHCVKKLFRKKNLENVLRIKKKGGSVSRTCFFVTADQITHYYMLSDIVRYSDIICGKVFFGDF